MYKSRKSETHVLGCMIVFPEALSEIAGAISHRDFANPIRALIVKTALDMHRQGMKVDYITLSDASGGEYDETLMSASSLVSSKENIGYHCSVLKDLKRRRDVKAMLETEMRELDDGNAPATVAMGRISSRMAEIEAQMDGEVTRMDDLISEFVSDCEERRKSGEKKPLGVPTGITALDDKLALGGLPRGLMTVVGGPSSHGKSSLAQAIMRHTGDSGGKALLFTLEDKKESVAVRAMSAYSKLQNRKLQQRDVTNEEWMELTAGAIKASKSGGNIYIYDNRAKNISELCAIARNHERRLGCDLMIFDYLQLMNDGTGLTRKQDRVDHCLDEIIKLSGHCRDTAIIVVSQLTKYSEPPSKSDLYHSAKIEQDSHTILLTWHPRLDKDYGLGLVNIDKQKDGEDGYIVAGWDANTARWKNHDDPSVKKEYLADVAKLVKQLERKKGKR